MIKGQEKADWLELDVETISCDMKTGIYRLRLGPFGITAKYQRGSGNTLIVRFHGALDRAKHPMPKFQGMLPNLDECHQLSVADPTLELHPDIVAGWYLGGEGLPMQSEFPRLIKRLSDHLGVQRRIYTGGSSGGFAALYYSQRDPRSVCIAVNPQTNLFTYKNAERQLRLVWPGAELIAEIGKRVNIDLSKTYDLSFENLVVYIQSIGDLRHYGTQMPEFLKIGLMRPDHFILQYGYWGVPGHSESVPINEYRLWVTAIQKTSWFNRQGILDAYHSLSAHSASHRGLENNGRTTLSESRTVTRSDLRLSNLLRDYHLTQLVNDQLD